MIKNLPRKEPLILLAAVVFLLTVLGINPVADRFTWFLENVPIMIAIPFLVLTYRKFPLTQLSYRLIAVHALILMIGGYYTYAEVPIGHWVKEAFGLERNHYDRLGHWAQGFVPAILVREFLLRKTVLKSGPMLHFLVVSVVLAISAFYEFFEWWVAVATGTAADAFLGSQGDVWDSQWDMFLAFCGAIASLAVLSGLHDRQIKKIKSGG